MNTKFADDKKRVSVEGIPQKEACQERVEVVDISVYDANLCAKGQSDFLIQKV